MWRPGRRMFSLACILILLTAILHTLGNVLPRHMDESQNRVQAAMQEGRIPMGMGMEPSFYDIFRALTFIMTVTFLALGGVGLLLAASRSVSSAVIRNMTWFYLVWNGAFTVLCFYYKVPPPLICGVVLEITLIMALALPAKSIEEASPVRV